METENIIIVSVLSSAWLLLLVVVVVLWSQVRSLRRKVADMQATGRLRVQKLRMDKDKNHAFHNPAISPDEELSKRGYSMYVSPAEDVESNRGTERQTGGQFVKELARELDSRRDRGLDSRDDSRRERDDSRREQEAAAPPFLLQSIEENKRRSRNLANPHASGRQSDTNPNFIY